MTTLSKLIQAIPPSPTLAAAAKANELKAKGKDVISFTVGEPDLDTPQHIKNAAIEALNKGFTKYTVAQGIVPLREAIVQKVERDNNLKFAINEVIVTNGGKQALATAFAVLLNPGDEVVIPAPYWTSYPDMVKLVGGVPVFLETKAENGYTFSGEELLKVCTAKTKAFIINTPSNPTGACFSAEQLKDIAAAVKSLNNPDLTVISDEVYEYITFDGFEHASFLEVAPELREQTLLVNAFSKAYSMTGWRVGYALGPKNIIDAMANHLSQFTSNVCSIAQYAASRAYEDGYEFPRKMQAEFAKRLEIVCDAVKEMNGIQLTVKPKGAFFAFLEIDGLIGKSCGDYKINCGQDFMNYLLEKYDVVVVQGEAFGNPKAVRMSFALDTQQLVKGLNRIKEAALNLR